MIEAFLSDIYFSKFFKAKLNAGIETLESG